MRVLIFSLYGDGGGLAYKMHKEGTQVDLFIQDPFYRKQMVGLVPHVETLEEGLKNKPDYILFDLNGEGKTADELRAKGFRVIGGSALADKLEMDRSYGIKVAQQYGISTPKTTEFKDLESAIAFVKKEKKPFAIKIDNNKSEASSYVAKDFEDMVGYLEQQKEENGLKNGETFILQEVIHGAEVSTELWFWDGVPIWPGNSTFESKKFLSGELGQRTGCETSCVVHYEGHGGRIVHETVQKLFPLLKYSKFCGPIDINCIVSEENHKPYFLEFTPRMGYSAIYAMMTMVSGKWSDFFYRVSRGTVLPVSYRSTWGVSLKLSIPPYPVEIEMKKASEEVYSKTQGTRLNGDFSDDFLPIDCQKGKKTDLEAAGSTCIVGECLGRGESLVSAWRGAQKVFKGVEIPNKQGRYTDGITDALERILKLRKWGYTDIPNPSGPFAGVRAATPSVSAPA